MTRTRVAFAAGADSQYFDLAVVRKGRASTFLFVSRLARSPFPESDLSRLAGVLASRISSSAPTDEFHRRRASDRH